MDHKEILVVQITHKTTATISIALGLSRHHQVLTFSSALIISIWRVVMEVALTTTYGYMMEILIKT